MKVKTVFLILIGLFFLVCLIGGVLWWRSDGTPAVASRTMLELDLTKSVPEDIQAETFPIALGDTRLRLREVVSALHRAAKDDRVVGLVAKTGASPGGLATLQELRDALVEFRESGKKTIAYTETFGEFGPSNGGYYLASALEEIYLQPSGDVGLTGLRYEVPFVAGTLEKLGLEAQMEGRYEYKNAINTYLEESFTEAHAEALQDLADSQFGQMVESIASGRGRTEQEVRELFDRGPYFGKEALEAGLVDGLEYRDEVYSRLEEELGDDVHYQKLGDYSGGFRPSFRGADTVALIYGVGSIVRGKSGYDPFSSARYLGADTVAQAFRDAVEDSSVEAILFRVNSPGGSYVASDTVWRESARAKEAGKPVIVSIGDVGGSGGYFIAMNADRIVAQPGTITGSIGVYGGKLVADQMWKKVGMTFDAVSTSENAAMWSGVENFDERGWQRMKTSLDRIYEDFVSKVAEGRDLELERVKEVAKGRIWSGERALELGLVDELGGFPVAYRALREELGLEEDAPLRLRLFPRPKSTWEVVFDRLSELGVPVRSVETGRGFERIKELVAQIAEPLRIRGVLEMPFVPNFR